MNLPPLKPLPPALARASMDSFRNNALRDTTMTPEEREQAACFYEEAAARATGVHTTLAQRYNRERARFLRGEVDYVAGEAAIFARESGGV